MSNERATCNICGHPMPPGEEMFKYHGYSSDCPRPFLKPPAQAKPTYEQLEAERDQLRKELERRPHDIAYCEAKYDKLVTDLDQLRKERDELQAELEKRSGNPSTLYYGVVAERDELLQRLADYEHETLTVKEALAERDRYREQAAKLAAALERAKATVDWTEFDDRTETGKLIDERLSEHAKAVEGK